MKGYTIKEITDEKIERNSCQEPGLKVMQCSFGQKQVEKKHHPP